jgi:uncharacterized membrane protein YoaK (UPF0700 family)
MRASVPETWAASNRGWIGEALFAIRESMQRYQPSLIAVAICLAALAGFVDALAFTSLGGFFASFMSGNSTRLGVGLATRSGGEVLVAGALVLSFVSGVILSSVIVRAAGSRHQAMLVAAAAGLLAIAALVSEVREGPLVALLMAAAMAVVHVLLRRHYGLTASLTDALVRLGESVADAMIDGADRWGWLAHLLLWSGFVAGAVLGTGAFFSLGLRALWFAVLAAGALWLVFRMRAHKMPG